MKPETLSPEILAELAKLRDIRVPDSIGWWPLAPGWWGLLCLAVALICVAMFMEIRRRRSLSAVALRKLKSLKSRLETDTDLQWISVELAVLLRRVSLSSENRNIAVHLAGNDWAGQLMSGDVSFTPETAEFLTCAPYAPPANTDIRAALTTAFSETERWIRRYA